MPAARAASTSQRRRSATRMADTGATESPVATGSRHGPGNCQHHAARATATITPRTTSTMPNDAGTNQ